MALQHFVGQSQELALAAATAITPEEREERQKQAEKLDEKLRFIVEKIPDRRYHIMGSNAGAGSGEFHMYRASRRREQERLERLDEDWDAMKASEDFQRKQEALQREDEERTAKRRAQRQKKKDKQKSKKQKQGAGDVATCAAGGEQQSGSGDAATGGGSGSEAEEEDGKVEAAPLD